MTPVQHDVRRTLEELVAIDSTSARSNVPIIEVLERRLRAAGFTTERHVFADDLGHDKVNLLARKGSGAGVVPLALVGHTDCVPFDAAWTDALKLTERDGKLYGRGACDTKAFVACALVAAERARLPDGAALGLVFTGDEEVGCLGAKRLVDARRFSAKYAIVGEPTSLRPIRANKGYALAEVDVIGVEGHSAYPETGRSAILHAARLLNRLERYANEALRGERDVRFNPPFTTVNAGVISGGKAKNIIPGLCRFTLEWRPLPGQPVEKVARDVEAMIAAERAADPTFTAQLRVLRMDRGFDTRADSPLLQFLIDRSGKQPDTVAFGTEGPQLVQMGAEPIVFGPGDIRNAHQTGEFVPMDELFRCEEILEEAIATFCVPA